MNRREFLKAGAGATMVGTVVSGNAGSTAGAASAETSTTGTPAVLDAYTAEDHRR